MVLRSKGVDVVYGQMPEHDVLVTYYDDQGISMERWDTSGLLSMPIFRRLPVFSNYEKARQTLRSHPGFHIGVLAGRRTFNRDYAYRIAGLMEKDWHLYFTKFADDSQILADARMECRLHNENATPCHHKSGVIHKYLAVLDVLVTPAKAPDRLVWEAKASGVPVISTDDEQEAIIQASRLHRDRKAFRDARAAAIDEAAGNDLAYEIIRFKERLKSVLLWSTSG